MIKDCKYILKRIIIGVGIVLAISFIRNSNVKALENEILYFNDSGTYDVSLYYNNTDNKFYLSNSGSNYNFPGIDKNQYPYYLCYLNSTNNQLNCYFTSIEVKAKIEGRDVSFGRLDINQSIGYNYSYVGLDNTNIQNVSYSTTQYWLGGSCNTRYCEIVASNYDIYDMDTGQIYFQSNVPTVQVPSFLAFNPIYHKTNNIITGITLSPEYSVFDTDNYIYQYSTDNVRWLEMESNNQLIDINNNITFYTRVKDKITGDYIDGASFTITKIGQVDDNLDYKINLSGEYRTRNYLNDMISSKSQSEIQEYQIYADYIPKNTIFKYQYQYVEEGQTLDNNNWITLPQSNNGSFTYVVNTNGTFYARMLDKEDNFLTSATFTVNSIGLIAIDNSSGVNDLIDEISNKVGFSGPIAAIIDIPVNLIKVISKGLAGGLTCTDYPLGSLFGTQLKLPCVNIRSHLGNSLYTTIDLIIACCMIYHIVKMFGELYTNLLFIQKNPIQDLGKRGD